MTTRRKNHYMMSNEFNAFFVYQWDIKVIFFKELGKLLFGYTS